MTHTISTYKGFWSTCERFFVSIWEAISVKPHPDGGQVSFCQNESGPDSTKNGGAAVRLLLASLFLVCYWLHVLALSLLVFAWFYKSCSAYRIITTVFVSGWNFHMTGLVLFVCCLYMDTEYWMIVLAGKFEFLDSSRVVSGYAWREPLAPLHHAYLLYISHNISL